MRKGIRKWTIKSLFLSLTLLLAVSLLSVPMKAEASWIDRDASGIYAGSPPAEEGEEGDGTESEGEKPGLGFGSMKEDDNAEEEELEDGDSFFVDIIVKALSYLISLIGRLLFGVISGLKASLDNLIYGRLVDEHPLFTFDLGKGNVYGQVSMAMYNTLSAVCVGLMMIMCVGKVAFSTWRRGRFAQASLRDALTSTLIGFLLLALMPNIVDVMLYVRDLILYATGTEGAKSLFGTDKATSIIAVLAEAANKDIVSALIFVAAVLLNLYFLLAYVGVALNMTINFILFPLVAIKSCFNDRKAIGSWLWEMVSCMMVPLIDAVLIMIPAFLGKYASEDVTGINSVSIALIEVLICYMIIPARNYARDVLGMRVGGLENTGLSTAALLGMKAAKGIKDSFAEGKEVRKNAENDMERANAEEDLAQNEKDAQSAAMATAEANASAMTPAGDIQKDKNMDDEKDKDKLDLRDQDGKDFDQERDNGKPFGRDQNYYDEMDAAAETERAAKEDLDRARDKKKKLQEKMDAVAGDDSLPDSEKQKQMKALREQMKEVDGELAELEERSIDTPNPRKTINDKLRSANDEKAKLEEQYNKAVSSGSASEAELENLEGQIKAKDQEIDGLVRQKMRLELTDQKEALSKEPQALRQEIEQLGSENESLGARRDALMRQKGKTQAMQDAYAPGSEEYKKLQGDIDNLNQGIAACDNEMGQNRMRQATLQGALAHQEEGLRDRQAYNLHERLEAQNALDAARSEEKMLSSAIEEAKESNSSPAALANMENRLAETRGAIKAHENRLGALANEDRRIAARLNETNPAANQYTLEELQTEKAKQNTEKAGIEKEIAAVNEKMVADPDNQQAYKEEIARLKTRQADCNLRNAKLDQMILGAKAAAGGSFAGAGGGSRGRSGAGGTAVSDEYDQRRAAIMERYANVDNFEEPEFRDLSHEKKAQFYRERALKGRQQLRKRRIGGAVGAMVGGTAGLWLGTAGVGAGGMIGHSVGSGVAENIAIRSMKAHSPNRPVDYSGTPLDVNIAADLRDNSLQGQAETIRNVQAQLMVSREGAAFQNAMREELINNNLIQREVRRIFEAHGITPEVKRSATGRETYKQNLEDMVIEAQSAVRTSVEHSESRIIERCAGAEFAKLSVREKQRLIDEAGHPGMDAYDDLCRQTIADIWSSL